MKRYWVDWHDPNDCDSATNQGFEVFLTLEQALEFINEKPNRNYLLIEGKEIELVAVQMVQEWAVK